MAAKEKKDLPAMMEKDVDAVRGVMVPSANGYDYVTANKDINSLLEKHLNKYSSVKILDFPYKKIAGSGKSL